MHIPVQGLVDGSMKPVQFPLIVRKSPVAADMALLMWRPDHGFDAVKISLALPTTKPCGIPSLRHRIVTQIWSERKRVESVSSQFLKEIWDLLKLFFVSQEKL